MRKRNLPPPVPVEERSRFQKWLGSWRVSAKSFSFTEPRSLDRVAVNRDLWITISVIPADDADLYRGEHSVRLLYLLTMLFAGLAVSPAIAAAPALAVTAGGTTQQFTAGELRAWPNAATVTLPHDPAYGRAMSYRAVPLRALLAALPPDAADTIEARATDGFVARSRAL